MAAARAAGTLGASSQGILTYLANTIAAGGREIPYSLVTALDRPAWSELGGGAGEAEIMLLATGQHETVAA